MRNKILNIFNSKITLYVVIAALGYFLFNTYQANQNLKASKDIWEEKAVEREKEILNLYDSLEVVKNSTKENINVRNQKISDILTEIDLILKYHHNEKAIDNLRDPDSIAELFSKYYPDHHRASEASD